MRMMPKLRIYVYSAEKARDATLDDEKYDVLYTPRWQIECPI